MADDESTMMLDRLPDPAELRKRMQELGLAEAPPVAAPPSLPVGPPPAPRPAPMVRQPICAPFGWESIPRLQARHVELHNRLLGLLPRPHDEAARRALESELEALVGAPCQVSYYGARLHEAPGAHVSLQGSCAVCWTMPPDSERCVLTVELALVTRGLELMLREGEERHTTALSHRDFALFLYVLLRGQAAMLGVSELVPLSCLANAPSAEEVHEALRSGLDVMECAFHVRLGAAHGWARLWVPSHMLDRAELFLRRGGLTEAEVEALASSALGDSLASLDVVAGVTSLGASELGDVSRGDIILFDEHGLQLDDDETTSSPGARVMLRGAGGSWISAQLKPSATGRWSVILHTPIHQPTTPRSEQMTQEHAASQTLGQQAAQEVPVLVEVRIGTLQAPLTTLARLTRGQVLTLNQPIGAPVEILAGGRVIATGELVNVEGRVGVRVL